MIIFARRVGLFSLFLQVVGQTYLCRRRGILPVVYFNGFSRYWSDRGHNGARNVWEYYSSRCPTTVSPISSRSISRAWSGRASGSSATVTWIRTPLSRWTEDREHRASRQAADPARAAAARDKDIHQVSDLRHRRRRHARGRPDRQPEAGESKPGSEDRRSNRRRAHEGGDADLSRRRGEHRPDDTQRAGERPVRTDPRLRAGPRPAESAGAHDRGQSARTRVALEPRSGRSRSSAGERDRGRHRGRGALGPAGRGWPSGGAQAASAG
jgi:hypothetical protein